MEAIKLKNENFINQQEELEDFEGLEIGMLGAKFTEEEILKNRERYIKEFLNGNDVI